MSGHTGHTGHTSAYIPRFTVTLGGIRAGVAGVASTEGTLSSAGCVGGATGRGRHEVTEKK